MTRVKSYGTWSSGKYYRADNGDTYSVKDDYKGDKMVFYHGNVNSPKEPETRFLTKEEVSELIFVD